MTLDMIIKVIKNGDVKYIGGWNSNYDDLKFGIIDTFIQTKGDIPKEIDYYFNELDDFDPMRDKYNYTIDFDKKEIIIEPFFIETIEDFDSDYGIVEKDGKYFASFDESSELEEILVEDRIPENYIEKTNYTFDDFSKAKDILEDILIDYAKKRNIAYFYKNQMVIVFDFSTNA